MKSNEEVKEIPKIEESDIVEIEDLSLENKDTIKSELHTSKNVN